MPLLMKDKIFGCLISGFSATVCYVDVIFDTPSCIDYAAFNQLYHANKY